MLVKIEKNLIILFMFYNFLVRWIFYANDVVMYAMLALIIFLGGLITIKDTSVIGDIAKCGLPYWFVLAGYSIIIGLIIAPNTEHLLMSVLKFVASLLFCYCLCVINYYEKSYAWILKTFLVLAYLYAVRIIFWGVGERAVSLGEGNNVNYAAIFMVYGMFSLFYLYEDSNPRYIDLIIRLFSAFLFMYIILLTASRKALIVSVFLALQWLFIVVKDLIRLKKLKILYYLLSLIIFSIIVKGQAILDFYTNSYASHRMFQLFNMTSTSDNMRFALYSEGLDMFFSSPIFGVGFAQYSMYSSYRLYSHSTYIEILSCCGIVGVVLFFYPIIKNVIQILMTSTIDNSIYKRNMLVTLLIIQLFLGTGVILYYDLYHLIIMLGVVFYAINENTTLKILL